MANEFIIKKGLISKANSVVSGSLIITDGASGSFSGSFEGDGSGLTNVPTTTTASYALTASYIETAQTASYVLNAISSSYSSFAISASYAVSASHEIIKEISSSYADTASFALSGNGIFSGSFSGSFEGDGSNLTNLKVSISSSYALTASYVETAQTASYVISSSIDGITDYVRNDQTSSMTVATASYVETAQTASYVSNAISSSYATTASYALTALSASYAPVGDTFPYTGSAIISGSLNVIGEFTASGLNYPSIDGDEKQLLSTDSSGTLTFDWADRTNIDVKNTSGVALSLGTPVYITGFQGASVFQISAASSSDATKMPAIGVLDQDLAINDQGHATLVGALRGFDTQLYTINDSLYVGEGELTKDTPTGSALIQKIARVGSTALNGEITILGAGRSNAVPNLLENQIFYGSGSNQAYQIHISGALDSTIINNITSSGVISSSFIGDGSGLTGVISSSYALTASYAVSASHEIIKEVSSSYADTASFAQSGDGIFSGSFSGSFAGDGFGLTDVPVTTTNILWVSTAGNNSTAQKGNVQRPWLSISASVAAASAGDSVIVEPGTYIESPFTVSNGITLKSLGSLKSATISASNNSAAFITQEANTRLEGFTVVCPSGSFPGIFYDSVGGGTIYDVTFKGQGNSIGFQISQSTAAISKVIFNEFRYGGGNFDKLAYVQGGILATDGVHVPGGGSVDKIFHTTAGRLQAINTNAGNLNVSSSFYNEGGTNVILGCNLFNVQEAFHLAAQDYTIQGMNVYVDDNVDKHITIDAGISGSNSIFNIISGHMQAAKITANPDWVSSNHAFSFQDDGVTLDPAFRIYSDLEVGHANKGFQLGSGEGLPYNKGMKIINSGSGGVSTDVTTEATSRDSSTFVFTYSGSGDAMYFGNVQKSPKISDLYLYFTGLQYKQVSTGSYSPGDLTLEIYTTASTWEPIDGAQCVSSEEGYNYANNVFSHNDSEEEIIANVNTDVWATASFFSTEARWGRIRILNPLTESPVFEQFLYTPNTTLINPKGQLSFRGKALQRQTIPIIGNTWGTAGLSNGELTAVAGDATWDHDLPGVLLNQGGDEAYNQLTIPSGTCTAFPLKITIGYYADSATGGAELDVVLIKGNGVPVNDPDGGKIPTPRTLANSDTFDDAALTVTTSAISFTSDNTLQYKTYAPIDISNYYEGDTILIRQRKGSAAGSFSIVTTETSFVKWTVGERTQ